MPTRKWFVTQITAIAALLTMWATTGGWDQEETVALIGLVSQAGIGYLTPNRPPIGEQDQEAGYGLVEVFAAGFFAVLIIVLLARVL